MSVELPPPQTPQAVSLAAAQASANQTIVSSVLGRRIHVSGAPLSAAAIDDAVSGSQSLAEALRDLTAACYAAGYPAAKLLYAEAGPEIYVAVHLGQVNRVLAPEPLQPYFEDLISAEPLTSQRFEPARVLASLHADRAGIYSVAHFVDDGAGGTALELAEDRRTSPYNASLEFKNAGNRFVGRNFVEATATAGDPWGDEFSVSWLEGLDSLSSNSSSDSYHGPSASWDRVTRWGVFGAAARYSTYEYIQRRFDFFGFPDDQPLTSKLLVPELSWQYLVLADFDRRWTLLALADHTSNHIERSASGEEIQSEVYPSIELASSYFRKLRLAGHHAEMESALSLRQGLGDSAAGLVATELDYFLGQPSLRLRFSWSERLQSRLSVAGQFSSNRVPQQEQFVLGGLDNVSAYLPGVAVGDSGLVGQLDTQYRSQLWGQEVTPRIFVEYGTSSSNSAPVGQSSRQAVADAGVGLGVTLTRYAEASLSSAWSIHDSGVNQADLDATDARVYFNLKLKL